MRRILSFGVLLLCNYGQLKADGQLSTSTRVGLLEGIDDFTEERRPVCATAADSKVIKDANVGFDMAYVTKSEDVYRFVGASASAKYGIGIGTRVEVHFGMDSEQFFSQNATVLAVAESVTTTSDVSIAPFNLSATLLDVKQTPDALFRKNCGTEFVTQVTRGGRFVALLRMETQSAEEKVHLKADVALALGPASASAEYQSAVHRFTKDYSLQVHLVRIGSEWALPWEPSGFLSSKARPSAPARRGSFAATSRLFAPDLSMRTLAKRVSEI